jgi:hypothetical protein
MQFDETMEQALHRIHTANRTCAFFLGLGERQTSDFCLVENSFQLRRFYQSHAHTHMHAYTHAQTRTLASAQIHTPVCMGMWVCIVSCVAAHIECVFGFAPIISRVVCFCLLMHSYAIIRSFALQICQCVQLE